MMRTNDVRAGDTVFRPVPADPWTGSPAYIRSVTVLANEAGTVAHTPGTVRVRFLSGTDQATGQSVRWTAPPSQWSRAVRPQDPASDAFWDSLKQLVRS